MEIMQTKLFLSHIKYTHNQGLGRILLMEQYYKMGTLQVLTVEIPIKSRPLNNSATTSPCVRHHRQSKSVGWLN
ncbi:hypothetical protein GBA52_001376 [Prunus armeniaca]|nr:hypothetical protein GBA52_001376 [Prunus armeniaca]